MLVLLVSGARWEGKECFSACSLCPAGAVVGGSGGRRAKEDHVVRFHVRRPMARCLAFACGRLEFLDGRSLGAHVNRRHLGKWDTIQDLKVGSLESPRNDVVSDCFFARETCCRTSSGT